MGAGAANDLELGVCIFLDAAAAGPLHKKNTPRELTPAKVKKSARIFPLPSYVHQFTSDARNAPALPWDIRESDSQAVARPKRSAIEQLAQILARSSATEKEKTRYNFLGGG